MPDIVHEIDSSRVRGRLHVLANAPDADTVCEVRFEPYAAGGCARYARNLTAGAIRTLAPRAMALSAAAFIEIVAKAPTAAVESSAGVVFSWLVESLGCRQLVTLVLPPSGPYRAASPEDPVTRADRPLDELRRLVAGIDVEIASVRASMSELAARLDQAESLAKLMRSEIAHLEAREAISAPAPERLESGEATHIGVSPIWTSAPAPERQPGEGAERWNRIVGTMLTPWPASHFSLRPGH